MLKLKVEKCLQLAFLGAKQHPSLTISLLPINFAHTGTTPTFLSHFLALKSLSTCIFHTYLGVRSYFKPWSSSLFCVLFTLFGHMSTQRLPKQLDWDLVERTFEICFKTNPRAVYDVETQSSCVPAWTQGLFIMGCANCDLLAICRFIQEDCSPPTLGVGSIKASIGFTD